MLLADGALGMALLVLWVYCIFDAVTSDAAAVRHLPKGVWVVLIIVLSDIGSLLWLVAGRPQAARSVPPQVNTAIPPEYDRPGRAVAASPDDDAAFLASLRVRADRQRMQAADEARRLRATKDEPPPS